MITVCNSTPLIALASLERLELLASLFEKIIIPQAVYDEIVKEGGEGRWATQEVVTAPWIETMKVSNRLAVEVLLDDLDLGEAETIVLARELGADWVLMDEKRGRRKLQQLGLNKIGTLGILLKAKQVGWLEQIRPEVEKLSQQGFRMSSSVKASILQQAGESVDSKVSGEEQTEK